MQPTWRWRKGRQTSIEGTLQAAGNRALPWKGGTARFSGRLNHRKKGGGSISVAKLHPEALGVNGGAVEAIFLGGEKGIC